MEDLRLLTLYKQYYLNNYEESLTSNISCIGYYDGLDLEKINNIDHSNIKNLWYATGNKMKRLPNGCSHQSIGLLRYVNETNLTRIDYTNKYWEIEKNFPFFSVAFLKLKKCEEYDEIGWNIERLVYDKVDWNFENPDEPNVMITEKICIALSYTTFDNSDMVLLLKSNSIMKLEEKLHKVIFPNIAQDEGQQEDVAVTSSKKDRKNLDQDSILYINMPRFNWVTENLKIYAEECYKEINRRLSKSDFLEIVEEIRQIYKLFSGFNGSDSKYNDIYEMISKCIADYRKNVLKDREQRYNN